MKVYKFYLYLSDRERQEIDIRCNKNSKYLYIKEEDMCFVLYAWTDKKKIRDEFLRTRSNSFIMKEQKIDDEESFHNFEVRYKEEHLSYEKLRTYNYQKEKYDEVDVLMTFDENMLFTEFIDENISRVLEPECISEYMYLKDEYIDALDSFLYTTFHDIFHAIDESVEDYVSYNLGFNLTPNGKDIRSIYQSIDQFKLFVHTFKDFFK